MTRVLVAAILVLGVLVGGARAQSDPRVLRFVPQADLRLLDPQVLAVYVTRNYGHAVYETLFAPDSQGNPQPQMVERWETSSDGLRWRFTLRPGLAFHDGADVTTTDVIASLKRWGRRDGLGQRLMAASRAMDAEDARSFTIVLAVPFPQMLQALAKVSGMVPFIYPARVAAGDAFAPIKDTIGSGPFRFVRDDWQIGARAVFARNAAYVPRDEPASGLAGGRRVNIDRLEWVVIPEASTAVSALRRGEVDWVEIPNFDLLPLLKSDPGVTVAVTDPRGAQWFIRPNHLVPPFNNPGVRRAILSAFSQADIMGGAVGDPEYWRACYSIYTCGGPYETEAGADVLKTVDVARAKRLLDEAGYKGEKVVVLDPADAPLTSGGAHVVADALRRIGMTVDLATTDWGNVIARIQKRDPVEQGGWSIFVSWVQSVDTLTPAVNLMLRAGGTAGGVPGWPDDPKVEAMRTQWLAETDPVELPRLAGDIQAEAIESAVYLPGGQFVLPTAFRKSISGVLNAPVPVFWNLEKHAAP